MNPEIDFYITAIDTVVERLPNPEWKLLNPTTGENYVLTLVVDGEATYYFGKQKEKTQKVSKGDFIFFTPSQIERIAFTNRDNPWHFITTTFNVLTANPESKAFLEELPQIIHNSSSAIESMMKELDNVWTGRRNGYLLKSRALIESMLYEIIRQNSMEQNIVHYALIESVRQYIQEHYDKNFSVAELAQMAHCSPSHFRMLFKKIVGMTATQYVSMVRINKAKDFLISGEMNVSEVAFQTGYPDIFYFSRQFKKITGHSPSFYVK